MFFFLCLNIFVFGFLHIHFCCFLCILFLDFFWNMCILGCCMFIVVGFCVLYFWVLFVSFELFLYWVFACSLLWVFVLFISACYVVWNMLVLGFCMFIFVVFCVFYFWIQTWKSSSAASRLLSLSVSFYLWGTMRTLRSKLLLGNQWISIKIYEHQRQSKKHDATTRRNNKNIKQKTT